VEISAFFSFSLFGIIHIATASDSGASKGIIIVDLHSITWTLLVSNGIGQRWLDWIRFFAKWVRAGFPYLIISN